MADPSDPLTIGPIATDAFAALGTAFSSTPWGTLPNVTSTQKPLETKDTTKSSTSNKTKYIVASAIGIALIAIAGFFVYKSKKTVQI